MCFKGLTGGLAAPLVAAGAGAIIGGAGAAALGSVAGVAIIGSLFGVAGAGLTGNGIVLFRDDSVTRNSSYLKVVLSSAVGNEGV